MAKKPKLKLSDRLEIKILLDKGYSLRAISRALERGHNTVAYEVHVNGGVGGYNSQNADQYARTRKKDTRREWSKIEDKRNTEMKTYIIQCLEKHWNPDEISGRMKRDKKPWYVSKTAIYEWLWSVYGQQHCVYLYSQRYHKKKRVKKTEREMIPNRVSITKRPHVINLRAEAGHWERDTIVSRKGCSGGVSTGSERVSRLIDATKVKSMSTFEHMEAVEKQKKRYITLSETFDNGIENKAYESLGIPSYFCEPYHSWEKGSIENANKMIRRYFPKGTNFRKVSQKMIDQIVFIINNKPRKILGYKTSLEVAEECGIIKLLSVVNPLLS
jgi:IS30 family transposase